MNITVTSGKMLTEVIEQVPIERMLLLAAAMLIVLCAVSSRLALTVRSAVYGDI